MTAREDIDNFMASQIKEEYLRLKDGDDSLFEPGERQKIVDALALAHDWWSLPSEWIVTKVNTP